MLHKLEFLKFCDNVSLEFTRVSEDRGAFQGKLNMILTSEYVKTLTVVLIMLCSVTVPLQFTMKFIFFDVLPFRGLDIISLAFKAIIIVILW